MSRPVLIAPAVWLAGPVAAFVVALPGALRLAGDRVGFLEAWSGAAGLMCPLLALAIATSRRARRALGAMETPLVIGVALWAVLAVPVTAVLGAILKANTHHRGLAGATFATFALAAHAGAALVAWRLTANLLTRVTRPVTRVALAWVAGVLALGLAGWVVRNGSAVDPSQASSSASMSALLVDGALAVVAVAVASRLDSFGAKGRTAWLGAGALALVTSVGIVVTARSPSLAGGMTDKAPLAGAVGRTLGLSGEGR